MLKQVILFCFLLSCSMAIYIDRFDQKNIKRQELLLEIDRIDKKLNEEILNIILNNQRNKRSDIDSRLMELQAKIDLLKAYQQMPAGHGQFDFEKIGKRFIDPLKFEEESS
ncbi:hypothetical protein BpHYR1_011964 [Brachionus plicatilis]|uniref:Uncharacterized protein n=1 Tax=Brachionus plicatilis TaxID=10195 RepID=A0A3M7S012_BRAPC|nr:hypothetical protein BpHYR1_011964 [Brachionus plicatilis]